MWEGEEHSSTQLCVLAAYKMAAAAVAGQRMAAPWAPCCMFGAGLGELYGSDCVQLWSAHRLGWASDVITLLCCGLASPLRCA